MTEREAALVRAIRRAVGAPVEAFHVSDVRAFAEKLVAVGVRVDESTEEAA